MGGTGQKNVATTASSELTGSTSEALYRVLQEAGVCSMSGFTHVCFQFQHIQTHSTIDIHTLKKAMQ